MKDLIQATLARVIGAVIGAGCGYLAAKGLPTLSPDASAQLTQSVTGGAMLVGYAISHKFLNRSINPSDTATGKST